MADNAWLNSILSIISAEKLNKMNKSVDMVRLLEKYDALLFPWTCHKPSLESPQKSNSKSNLYRNQGNEQYVQKHYVKALDLFNQSICWAPSASEQLSKGYANRSVVYSSLKMYEKCLKRNKSASNKFSTAKDAILIYKFLLSTTAFKKIFKNHEQIDFLIDLISRLLRIASLNTFNVQSVGNFFSERRSEDGQYSCGIYLLMSLMNHSCAPNTYHVRYGFDNTVIVAKPIKAGEQLFVSYKLSVLEHYYGFKCGCVACINDYPQLDPKTMDDYDFKFIKPLSHVRLCDDYELDAVKQLILKYY